MNDSKKAVCYDSMTYKMPHCILQGEFPMKRYLKTPLSIALVPALFALTTHVYAADAAASVSPAEKAKIEAVVHDYLIQKPEVLVEALQILQKRQYEEAEATVKKTQQTAGQFAPALFHGANDPIAGNPNGQITVAEFFDYQC